MLVERVANMESSSFEPDGDYLSADELWTPRCNLVRGTLGPRPDRSPSP